MRRAVLFFASMLPLLAAEPEWTYISSPNFELYSSADPKQARKIIEHFEQVREFFMRTNSSEVTTRLPVTIVLFRNTSQYKPYAPTEAAAAYYAGSQERDYIVLNAAAPGLMPIAVHEYVHLLVRHSGLHLPPWLNEGLAEVYSTIRPEGSRILVGEAPPDRARILKTDRWLPIDRLLAVGSDSPEYNELHRAGIFYAQSWLLVHMLAFDEYMRDGFPRFLDAIAAGRSAAEASDLVWKLPVVYLGKKLEGYARNHSLGGIWYDVKLERFAGLETRTAEGLNVDITLASLSALLGRSDESIGRLRVLAKENPASWRAQEALALAAWMHNDLTTARESFRRATELNSPNWKTWFDYARLVHGIDDEYESGIKALRRALELNPGAAEARVLLAEEYNYARRYKDAIAAATSRTPPELAARAFLAAAYAHLELGNEAEARRYTQLAREHAKEPHEHSRAADILRDLETRAQARITPRITTAGPTGAPPAPAPAQPRQSLSGVFKQLDCLGAQARLHLQTPEGLRRLLIRDPSRIAIRGRNAAMSLSCGAQPAGRKITVEYLPNPDKPSGTLGDIRIVEFH